MPKTPHSSFFLSRTVSYPMGRREYNDPRLKILAARRLVAAVALAALLLVAIALVAVAIVSVPRPAERPAEAARVVASARCAGPLSVGTGAAPFALPANVPIAGFARLAYRSRGMRDEVGARALVLSAGACKVALASADLLLVPEALEDAVLARITDVGLTGLVLAATHTHAGPGGYWENVLAERIGTAPYDPHVRDAIAGAIAEAIRKAAAGIAPARVAVARGEARGLARSRSGGAAAGRLEVIRFERPDGAPVAEVAVFAAHATILGSANRLVSGDWPGRFTAEGAHGPRLLLQGAVGDQSPAGPAASSPEAFANALSQAVAALRFGPPSASPELAFATAETALPFPDPAGVPAILRRAARNVANGALPARARVSALRVGPALLVAVPAEPVSAVAASWLSALPRGAAVVSLADGYAGYVETAQAIAARGGEAKRSYYGPDLARRLGDAARAAAKATAPSPQVRRRKRGRRGRVPRVRADTQRLLTAEARV